MPFTMPNYDMPSQPELGNPLSASISGLLAGANAAPTLKKNMAEAKYAGLTAQANAMSKIAYASLLGPQYIAKLMANPSFWHSLPDEMKDAFSSLAVNAATGQTNAANNFLNNNSITDALHKNNPNTPQSQQQNNQVNPPVQNQQPNISPTDQQNIDNMTPGQSVVIQGNGNAPGSNSYDYDQNGENVKATSNEVNQIANNGNGAPSSQETPVTQVAPQTNSVAPKRTYAEREADYENVVAEGKELGGARGKAIGGLGEDIKGIKEESGLLGQITNLLKSPEIQSVRKLPIGGKYELLNYKINGTPEQKQAIGSMESLTSELATQMTQRYKGSFKPTSEMPLINQAKVNLDKDTLDSATGKLTSLITLNKMDDKRDHIAYELMHGSKHMDEIEAYEQADKQVDGDKIRREVTMQIYPSIMINGKRYFNIDGKMMQIKGQ